MIFDKITQKKKKKYYCQEQIRKNFFLAIGVHIPIITNMAHKNLSFLTYFNSDKKGHYIINYCNKLLPVKEKQRYLKRLVIVLANSILMRLTQMILSRPLQNKFLIFVIQFDSRKMKVDFGKTKIPCQEDESQNLKN